MDYKSFGEVTMAHVVIVTSQTAGRVQLAVELARRLVEAGHQATVASPVDISEQIAVLGAKYQRLGPTVVASGSSSVDGNRVTGILRRLGELRSARERMAEKVDAMELDRITQQLADLGPDLVLVDVEIPAVVMSAVGAGRSVAVWTTMLSVWKRPGLPPLGSATVPGSSIAGSRLGMELEWLRFRVWETYEGIAAQGGKDWPGSNVTDARNRSQDWLLAQGDFAQSMACSIRLSELAHADLHRSGA